MTICFPISIEKKNQKNGQNLDVSAEQCKNKVARVWEVNMPFAVIIR